MKHAPLRLSCRNGRCAGFSLIEMLVVAAIAAVLASIAYPAFAATLHKARRTEAVVALLQVQQAQERFRSEASRYGSLADIGIDAAVPGGHYLLGVESPDASGYVVTAVASGSQAADRACRHLRVTVDAGGWTTSSGPGPEAANDAAANRRCWNL